MTRRRHLATVALASALVLASCGSDDPSDDPDNTPPPGDAQEDDGPPTELTIHVQAADGTPPDDVIKAELDAALNLDVQLTSTAGEDYYTQLGADLAAGNTADMFQVDRPRLQQFIEQGLILDLTDYLDDELAPYAEWADPNAAELVRFDGRDYGITKKPTFIYESYWIRKDWLDNLGLSMPETTDDLLDVATAFTEDDPNGTGNNDTYGITGGESGLMWTPLWAAFGSGGVGGSYGARGGSFYRSNGEIVNGIHDPNTVEAIAYIQSLIEAGVVDPDFLTIDDVQAHERAMQGTAGIVHTQWPQMTKPEFVEQYRDVQPDAEWVQLLPPVGPTGAAGYPRDESVATVFAIPASLGGDEKLDKLFELLNYVSGEEGNRLVSFGVEGEHYTLEGDDIVATGKMDSEGGYFWLYQLTGRAEAEYLPVKFAQQAEYIDLAANQQVLPLYDSLVIVPDGYNATDAGRFAQENLVQFIDGARPLTEYDEFLDTLANQFGHQQYVDSAVEQLAAINP